jgi:hypothetical protein
VASPTPEFLESGSALVVATVDGSGSPIATRGWGMDVVSADGRQLRILLDADDTAALENLRATAAIAITATHVPTLRSYQLKGRVTEEQVATDDDRARVRRYCDEFFGDVEATDGIPPHLMERLVPANFVVFDVVATETFDQTPGPGAGASVST